MRRTPLHPMSPPKPGLCKAGTARSAFTLVELLVAITIFAILAAIAIGAYRGVSKDDRISAGAQQLKGWFEHARSRAIHDKQPRGIRFLPDQNNPRLCTSAVYIGGAGYDEGNLTATPPSERKYLWIWPNPLPGYRGFDWPVGTVLLAGGVPSDGVSTGSVPSATNDPGYAAYASLIGLYQSGAISDVTARTHSLRIEIPRGSGMWHPVRFFSEDLNGDQVLQASEDLNGNGQIDPIIFLSKPVANFAQYIGLRLDYRLELGPTVLTDSDNHPLPRGVVIDLDASWIPDTWRPANGAPYTAFMDVMFSPRGTFTGTLPASQGILHFCVSTLEDAERFRSVAWHPADPSAPTGLFPYVLADPTTPQRLVSIYLSSGRVSTANVFLNPADDSTPNPQNDRAGLSNLSNVEPFSYALRGQEAK